MVRVLVVEDDPVNQRYVARLLRDEGHEAIFASRGSEAIPAVDRDQPDVILLDIGLPDVGGIELCRRIRTRTNAPVIFVSGRHDDVDKVMALDAGGDDYIVKPFSGAELAARVRAVLRRSQGSAPAVGDRLAGGGIVLDAVARRVYVRGAEVALTAKEFDLLRFLMSNSGRAVDRQEIFDAVWGQDFYGDESALNVYMRQLRQKIETDPARPVLIQTVRSVGYRFAPPGGSAPTPPAESAEHPGPSQTR